MLTAVFTTLKIFFCTLLKFVSIIDKTFFSSSAVVVLHQLWIHVNIVLRAQNSFFCFSPQNFFFFVSSLVTLVVLYVK